MALLVEPARHECTTIGAKLDLELLAKTRPPPFVIETCEREVEGCATTRRTGEFEQDADSALAGSNVHGANVSCRKLRRRRRRRRVEVVADVLSRVLVPGAVGTGCSRFDLAVCILTFATLLLGLRDRGGEGASLGIDVRWSRQVSVGLESDRGRPDARGLLQLRPERQPHPDDRRCRTGQLRLRHAQQAHLGQPRNEGFAYGYDAASNLTQTTYPDGTVVSYAYDDDERMLSAATGGQTTNYAYNAASDLTKTTFPAGNGYAETRTYDRAGQLIDVKNANAAGVLSEFAYTLDPVGNPTTIVTSGGTSETATYGYDLLDRLTSVCFKSSCPRSNDPYIRWTYDKVGNRLTETRPSGPTTYGYNAADELTAAGSTAYGYDQNGNQTAAGTRSFSYDLANRLTSTTSGTTTTTYAYDGDGVRLKAQTGPGAAEITNYLWDVNGELPQLALEQDGANTPLRRYSTAPHASR
jgi:YD repeat-containing protein